MTRSYCSRVLAIDAALIAGNSLHVFRAASSWNACSQRRAANRPEAERRRARVAMLIEMRREATT